MGRRAQMKQKFCGNCGNHNAYNYPNQVLCWMRFSECENPVVQTLWCCKKWNPSSQECYCIEEAMKNKTSK